MPTCPRAQAFCRCATSSQPRRTPVGCARLHLLFPRERARRRPRPPEQAKQGLDHAAEQRLADAAGLDTGVAGARRGGAEARRQGGKEARRQGGHGYQSPNRVRRRHESRGADRLTSASEHPYFTAAVACPGPRAPGAAAGATTGRRQRTACATIPGLMHSLAASNRSRDATADLRHSR